MFSSTKGFGFEFNTYKDDEDITCWINDDDDDVAYDFPKTSVIDDTTTHTHPCCPCPCPCP